MSANEPPAWLLERAQRARDEFGVPIRLAIQIETEMAVMDFGVPLPEEDPYEQAERESRRERNERYERALGSAYDRKRFVGGDA